MHNMPTEAVHLMNMNERLIERFRALTAEADALPYPVIDREETEKSLILKYDENCRKEAARYARQGCYVNGNVPKKSVIQKYKQTKEYKRRYHESLERSSYYQEITDGTITENPVFRRELEKKLKELEAQNRRTVRKEIGKKLRKISKNYIYSLNLDGFYTSHMDEISRKEKTMADSFIRSDRINLTVLTRDDNRLRLKVEELNAGNWDLFTEQYRGSALTNFLFDAFSSAGICAASALVCVLSAEYPFLAELIAGEDTGESASVILNQIAMRLTEDYDEDEFIRKYYDFDHFVEMLEENEVYGPAIREGMLRRERQGLIALGIADVIPNHYPDLFPLARAMQRHFILHIGPTNSGKTHDAIEALKNAESGVYLAPLRLLAYEQYDTLNRAGAACTLVTGEERRVVDGAYLRSSTIEMLDFKRRYEVAVIDEAQMACDDERGGAWTAAILGVRAKTVHVCAAPSAESLITRLVGECGDSLEIVRHERKTPLRFEHSYFSFPDDVRPGDALIVFSRRDVHAVAADLQKLGKTCSIIYGALPYDVRYEEARRFREGETDIVVATDAIGMGLNMPVRRIVFLETDKFDGYERRELYPSEIQQIGGRAGRYGIFDEGLVNTLYDVPLIEGALQEVLPQDQEAVVAFPEELLRIEAPLSEILLKWAEVDVTRGFRKNLAEREILLARLLEEISDDKYLIYRFVTMAFDETNEDLMTIWRDMFICENEGRTLAYAKYLPDRFPEESGAADLPALEAAFHVCDLLYSYLDRFDHPEGIQEILDVKEKLSLTIMKILEKQELTGRRCKECGRPLPWNARYGICDRCHFGSAKRRRKRHAR